MFAFFQWDPSPILYTIPYLNHPIRWYGFFFAFGFFLSYLILLHVFKVYIRENEPKVDPKYSHQMVDSLAWYVVLGTLLGARLGHVFIYEWYIYKNNLLDIFKVWEGGLASHGGAIGIIIALFLFYRSVQKKLPHLTYLKLVDLFCIPVPLAACCIRIGNFINQEILGTPSNLPWAVKFGHPYGTNVIVPRHPVQLYEGLALLAIFALLYSLWYWKRNSLRPGTLVGWTFITIFTSRILLESFKVPQSIPLSDSFISMGQLLSLPFILLGVIFLILRPKLTKSPC